MDTTLLWPRCVPNKQDAWQVLFGSGSVPTALTGASIRFFSKLSGATRQLFDEGLASDAARPLWAEAAIAAWRLEMALALPRETGQDDAALRDLIEDAVMARDALNFAHTDSPQLLDAITETRHALFEAWGLLLRRTATPSAPARQPLRVGMHQTVEQPPSMPGLVGPAAALTFAAATVWLLMRL